MKREPIAVVVWAAEQDRAFKSAQHLNAPIYYAHILFFQRNIPILVPLRYLVQAIKTWAILLKKRPRVVHVTNPPIFAPLTVFLYSRLFGAAYIMDTHSPALYSHKWGWTLPLQRLMARGALVNITDQDRFKKMFEDWGAKAIILPKPPGKQRRSTLQTLPLDPGCFCVTVVNTFGPDEPLLPIFEAAVHLTEVHFYVLGNTRLADKALLASAPPNITFTGYLHKEEYWEQLLRSDAVMTLTTYPYSLLAGGQDGMIVGKPLILSEQPVLQDYFTKGAVFVDNTARGIIKGVRETELYEDRLREEVIELSEEKRQEWESRFQELRNLVQTVPGIA
jgi:glycosyltransferase involved in cell wall biosynthesis